MNKFKLKITELHSDNILGYTIKIYCYITLK
jgi:hypothetical protein